MLTPKKKTCDGCGEQEYIWKSEGRMKYCKTCWYKIKSAQEPIVKPSVKPEPVPVKRTFRIKPVSDKQSKLMAGYSRLRKLFFAEPKNCVCHAKLPGCLGAATDVHHKKGRGIYLLDISTWLPVCRRCHAWIETHPKEAKELGFSEYRLTNKNEETVLQDPVQNMDTMESSEDYSSSRRRAEEAFGSTH